MRGECWLAESEELGGSSEAALLIGSWIQTEMRAAQSVMFERDDSWLNKQNMH